MAPMPAPASARCSSGAPFIDVLLAADAILRFRHYFFIFAPFSSITPPLIIFADDYIDYFHIDTP
jgi:hypothetical protein